jgi:multiple sugar transport system ATP-binding protein
VVVVEPLGSHLLVTATVGEQQVKVVTRVDATIQPDDRLWLRPEPDKLRWFDEQTGQEIAP